MSISARLSALRDAGKRLKRKLVGEDVWTGPGSRYGAVSTEVPDVSYSMGSGTRAVLLIHGLTGTPVEMRYVAKGLAAAGYHVHALQLAGHCGTEGDLLHTNWRDWTASVDAAYLKLAGQYESVAVAGLSMGSMLALHLAASRPVAGIVLYSPVLWYDGWTIPRLYFLLPLLIATGLGNHYRLVETFPYGIKDDRLRAVVVKRMLSGDSAGAGTLGMAGATLREMRALIAQVKRELPAITAPTLILHSSEDDVASVRNADYLEAKLAGPVRKVVLNDCYHLIVLDRQRARVVQETVNFLEGLQPDPGLAPSSPRLAANATA
ncbi:MAG: alpha/beta hydrolase [Bacteroidota bacterium]